MSSLDGTRLGGFADLAPIAFLERSGRVFAPRPAIGGDSPPLTYAELLDPEVPASPAGPGRRVGDVAAVKRSAKGT